VRHRSGDSQATAQEAVGGDQSPRKRRKVDHDSRNTSVEKLEAAWEVFRKDVHNFASLHTQGGSKLIFSFVEGPLVKALRDGDW
jgi:midasin